MNRRQFLTASAAGLASPASLFADDKPRRVGLIGSGWYGKCDILRLIQIAPVEVVSLCDVDKRMLAEAADIIASRQKSKKKPRIFTDYRKMLAEKDLDMVEVATPDHWHALPMIEAVQAGLDVYVQKPVGVDIVEGQAMVAAARKHGRVVQVGTQRRSTPHLIEARDRIVREGKLGKVAFVEICCYYPMRASENPPDTAPPDYLDYDFWTGPAPMRPYNSLVHPRGWRAFMEYGNGIVGDMCVHMLDMVRWMLDLGWPTRVSSTGGILMDKKSKANISDTQTAEFEFPDLRIVWTHRSWGKPTDEKYPWGATLYGDKGTLKADVYGYDFIPMGRGEKPVRKDVTYEFAQYPEDRTEKDLERHCAPAIRGHMRDWLTAIDKRGKPVADIEQGHISTAACILANLSMKLGRDLKWDAAKQRVVGDEEANRLLRRAYRKPWVHPGSRPGLTPADELRERGVALLRGWFPVDRLDALSAAAAACFDAFEAPAAQVPARCRFNPLSAAAILPSLIDFGVSQDDLEALVAADGLAGLVRDALGRDAVCNLEESWVRRRYAPRLAPRLHHPNIWHQDGGLGVKFGPDASEVPAMTPLVTCWIPLQACSGDCPALELVARPLDRLIHYTELDDGGLRRRFGAGEFESPTLEFGDGLLFLNGTLHRTWVRPEMQRNRLSVDYRFFPR